MPKNMPPRRRANKDIRGREHLTEDEVERMIDAARSVGRHRHRDATMIMLAHTHALRVIELVKLKWDNIDLTAGSITCIRVKGSKTSTHPLRRKEIAALKKLSKDRKGYVFVSERGSRLSTSGVRKIVSRAAMIAEIEIPGVHPHMFRHGCGHKLTNDGRDTRAIQEWMGHAQIANTVKYTELSPNRFEKHKFWDD